MFVCEINKNGLKIGGYYDRVFLFEFIFSNQIECFWLFFFWSYKKNHNPCLFPALFQISSSFFSLFSLWLEVHMWSFLGIRPRKKPDRGCKYRTPKQKKVNQKESENKGKKIKKKIKKKREREKLQKNSTPSIPAGSPTAVLTGPRAA